MRQDQITKNHTQTVNLNY